MISSRRAKDNCKNPVRDLKLILADTSNKSPSSRKELHKKGDTFSSANVNLVDQIMDQQTIEESERSTQGAEYRLREENMSLR
jgi:hypothetical protein